ncbi:MAG: hypothetical protein ACJARR_001441 [Pseudophaeobacter arcticus]
MPDYGRNRPPRHLSEQAKLSNFDKSITRLNRSQQAIAAAAVAINLVALPALAPAAEI